MAELLAGAPAALFLASMFQRDEHGHKRIPVLLEQLKVTITDTDRPAKKEGDRHTALRIELEYGSGMTRMKWVVYRSVADFANLHLKFKVQEKQDAFRSRPANRMREIKDKATIKDGENEKEEDKEDPRSKLPRFPRTYNAALPYIAEFEINTVNYKINPRKKERIHSKVSGSCLSLHRIFHTVCWKCFKGMQRSTPPRAS
jgi:phospholipase D1/2